MTTTEAGPEPTGETPAPAYAGKVRVMDRNGLLLDVGKGDLRLEDPGTGEWGGSLRVFEGSCLTSKSITSLIELGDGTRALAQVGPKVADAGNDLVDVAVAGIGPIPF